jgi:hypothetical protein
VINKIPTPNLEAQQSAADLHDEAFCTKATIAVLRHIAPGYKPPTRPFFRTIPNGDIFTVETNLDLREADDFHRRLFHDASPLTEGRVLVDVFNAGTDLRLAATHGAEMAVAPEVSDIAQIRFSQSLERRKTSDAELNLFQDDVFNDGRAIQEAVNSNHKNFEDIIAVAAKARQFKEWIASAPEDASLRKEYLHSVSKLDWMEGLPAKSLRWLIFTGAGLLLGGIPGAAGLIASTLTGVSDTFLVDHVVKGWKPNQFVEGPLRDFVERRK